MSKQRHRLTVRCAPNIVFDLKLVALYKKESLNDYIINAVLDKLEKDLAHIKLYVK